MKHSCLGAVAALLLVFVGTPAQADDAFAGSGAGLFNTYGFDTEISSSWTPFQLTLVPYLQFFRSDVEVCGLNLAALLTNQYRVYGISIAPFAACNEVGGLEVKGFGAAERNLGFSIGIVSIFVENLGAMFGVVNLSGVDAGRSAGNSWGWQIGLYNHNENQGAVQIGLLNYNARAAIPWLPFFNLSGELADDVKAAAQAAERGK